MKEVSLYASIPGREQSADTKNPVNKLDQIWDVRAYKACSFMQRYIADHPEHKEDCRVSVDALADLVREHLDGIRADFHNGLKNGTVVTAFHRYLYAKDVVYWHGLLKLLRKMAHDWDTPSIRFCADDSCEDANDEPLPEPNADDRSNDQTDEDDECGTSFEDVIRFERNVLCEGIRRHPEKLDNAVITVSEAADWMRYVMLVFLERYGSEKTEHSEDTCIALARNLLIANAVSGLLETTAKEEGDAYLHLCDLGCAAVRHREQRKKENTDD